MRILALLALLLAMVTAVVVCEEPRAGQGNVRRGGPRQRLRKTQVGNRPGKISGHGGQLDRMPYGDMRHNGLESKPRGDGGGEAAPIAVPFTAHGVENHVTQPSESFLSKMSMQGCLSTVGKMATGESHTGDGMSDNKVQATCKMYMDWGKNMRKSMEWKPTDKQMAWWKSLGMASERTAERPEPIANRREPRQSGNGRANRKEYRMLADDERQRFHQATNTLKNRRTDGMSHYDIFIRFHQANVAPGAHFGPAFLGYHRELLLRFENALRQIDPTVALPYWDSNLDHHLGDDLAQLSVMWTPDFLGNGKGDVTSGPFAHWPIPYSSEGRPRLFRNLTVAPAQAITEPNLMSDAAVRVIINARSMREITWFVDPSFESHHGALHNWVGGVMGDLPNSPSDPVFFLHHAFIDCLWEQMRDRQRRRADPRVEPLYDFPNDTEALGVGIVQPDGTLLRDLRDSNHYALSPMAPFLSLSNIDGLGNEYFERYYACASSPTCTQARPDCGSPYLFCDIGSRRCAPRLQLGAPCARFPGSDPCHGGRCCADGRCHVTCPSPPAPEATLLPRDVTNQGPPVQAPTIHVPSAESAHIHRDRPPLPVDRHTPDVTSSNRFRPPPRNPFDFPPGPFPSRPPGSAPFGPFSFPGEQFNHVQEDIFPFHDREYFRRRFGF